jgi:flagellar L-ring protein precursor FlgH
MMRKLTLSLVGLSITILLSISFAGCAAIERTAPPVAEKIPQPEKIEIKAPPLPPVEYNGSLYDARSNFNGFFIDTKARSVGDIVTVNISESAKATNSADTQTGRTSSLEAGIDTLFGTEDWYRDKVLPEIPSDLPRPDPFGNPSVKGSMTSDFDGSGSTSRMSVHVKSWSTMKPR